MIMHDYLERKRNALLQAANRFFLPSGVSIDDCLAAYQFKGVASKTFALYDWTGHGYNLTGNSFGWSASEGFKSGSVTQNALTAKMSQIVTQIVYYDGFERSSGSYARITYMGYPQVMLYQDYGFQVHDSSEVKSYGKGHVGALRGASSGDSSSGHWNSRSFTVGGVSAGTSGVIGYGSNGMWKNGTAITASAISATGWPNVAAPSGTSNQPVAARSSGAWKVRILAAAFYKCTLTTAQHKEVADAMRAM